MQGADLQAGRSTSRREFLQAGAAAGLALSFLPRRVLGGGAAVPPSETLTVAVIGTGGRGQNLVEALLPEPDVRIAAICDVTGENDYSAFYYRKPAGRNVVQQLIESHYAPNDPTGTYEGLPTYVDFRVMLEKERGIDAVVVATPDHSHAVITLAAIALGKHVYCEKPLARTIEEVRKVTETARAAKVATQMGQQGHSGEGIRQICEWIWDGAIGPVREVHAWSDTGGWAGREDRPAETPPVPADLDWDLWLGPAPHRPYHPIYTPYNWRGWWDFGTGSIGDMGCHNMDPALWALRLGHPATVEAYATRLNSETTPLGAIVRYEFPARGDMPPVRMTWYDAGLRPPRPDEMDPAEKFDPNGILFVGDKGKILSGGWGGLNQGPRLLPKERMDAYSAPAPTLPRSAGHQRDWVDACKGGPPASANFDVSGPLTELVLLGNVAMRSGAKLAWDGAAMRAVNAPQADEFIRSHYRAGWTL